MKLQSLIRNAILTAAVAVSGVAVAQSPKPLQMDAAIRYGVLPNGLTYYIRHNPLPKDRANFYIAQKVGSVQEDDSQRGLAHFLEHMCFNGSENFKGNGIVSYCERIGVKFGQNLNAYTSTDETVYNIDDVPTSQSNIDSCLLILHDWADGLTLDPAEIDKERGVIHEEWRLRSSAMQRIIERNLPKLYPGSKYGHRMPIGLLSIIDSFKPKALRDYYEKWYRPDLQGIVIVGDIDAEKVENQVKAMFSDIKMPANPAKYETYPVPDNHTPIYITDKDKELTAPAIFFMYKHDPQPDANKETTAYVERQYINAVLTMSLNGRLDELSRKSDCPFDAAGIDYSNYLLSKTKDALNVQISPKPGKSVEAVKTVITEIERARKYGFTETEVERAAQEYLSRMEKVYLNREKQYNSFYVDQYVRHFLEKEPIPSIEDEFAAVKEIIPQITAQKISDTFAAYTHSTDTNFVFTAVYPESVEAPSIEEFQNAVAAALKEHIEPYVDNVKAGSLVPNLPAKGKILKEEPADFGYTHLTLSNGANVYFKSTDFNESQVIFTATSFGGYLKTKPADHANVKVFGNVMNSTGLGDFTQTELDKKLAGKQVTTTVSLGEDEENLGGSATPKDMRTLFELIHLRFCKPSNDPEGFQNIMNQLQTYLENADKKPQRAFNDSISAMIYSHKKSEQRLMLQDLKDISYDAVRRIYSERFASPGDFNFFFTGKIDADSLKAFAEEYIASLPGCKQREPKAKEVSMIAKGKIDNRFTRQMETPQAMIFTLLSGNSKYSLKNSLTSSLAGDILRKLYTRTIREEAGIAYTVSAEAGVWSIARDQNYLQVVCPTKPLQVDSALLLVNQGIEQIAKDGVSKQDLDDVVKFRIKQHNDNQRKNGYWNGLISRKVTYGVDNHTGYEQTINSITSADIQKFLNKAFLKSGNRITVVMMPEDFTDRQ